VWVEQYLSAVCGGGQGVQVLQGDAGTEEGGEGPDVDCYWCEMEIDRPGRKTLVVFNLRSLIS